MGRHPNHDTPYLVHPVAVKHYRYAAVYRTVPADNAKDKPVRKKVYIGTLDEHLVFHPNNNLRLMDISERRKLIFPETWDLTAFHRLDRTLQSEQTSSDGPDSNAGKTDRDNAGNDEDTASTDTSGSQTASPALQGRFPLYNKIYGDFWFCEEILKLKGAHEDLLVTFDYDAGMVDDITTLAIYPLLSQRSYNMVASWQQYHHTPSLHSLDSSFISRLSKRICDGHRLEFSRLRIGRQPPGTYGCVDSTTRSAYTSPTHIVNVRFGHNKDGVDLACTSDVVVYSLATHEPVYYKSFPGNQSDMTTIRTVLTELRLLGITNIILITDRGYSSMGNIASFISEGVPFLTAAKVEQTPVVGCLSQIKYDQFGLPSNMIYDEETDIYCSQVSLEPFDAPLPDGSIMKAENVKANLY